MQGRARAPWLQVSRGGMRVTGRGAGFRECRAQVTPVTSCPTGQSAIPLGARGSHGSGVPPSLVLGRGGRARGTAGERRLRPDASCPAAVWAGPLLIRAPSFGFSAGSRSIPAPWDSADPALWPRAAGGRGGARALSPGPSDVPGGPASGRTPRGEVLDSGFEPKSTLSWEGARPGLIADGDHQTRGPLLYPELNPGLSLIATTDK